ncbi:MAG: SMP-30/gluconolactonase/LRE family protein [Chloroflexota bacterium]|nr:SMP-30/gluconolactonase/LRE family protein [Chloroflexota bacterium]
MKPLVIASTLTLIATTLAAPVAAQTPEATPAASPVAGGAVFADIGLQTPESVLYDQVDDIYLISNINGNPFEADDNGFIMQLSPEGDVFAERWIDGAADDVDLDAPKGMAVVDDNLYVTDIDVIRVFDRTSGAPIGTVEIPGATFLNDLAAGPDDSLYVTDMGVQLDDAGEMGPSGTDAVYRIDPDGTVTSLVQAPDIATPNGVEVNANGDIYVVSFAEAGDVFLIQPDGGLVEVAQVPGGLLDGIIALDDGSLLVSSWGAMAVVRITADGEQITVVDGIASPADLGYDSTRNLLLIPDFMGNRVLTVPLPD